MRFKRFFTALIFATLLSVFSVTVRAETVSDIPPETPPQTESSGEDIVEPELTPLQQFVKAAKENGTVYEVKFTGDSACTNGIYVEPLYDELEEKLYLSLVVDLPTGYVIYDNIETEYTDGLKINDSYAVLGNKPFKIYLDDPLTSYTFLVKTTYSDTMYGTIAKIQDGNATILDLFENPVMLMQVAYYFTAAVSLIVASVLASKSKKYKAKTTDEIATATENTIKTTNDANKQELISAVLGVVTEQLLPAINNCVSSNQSVVKAVALSNSKSKTAPVALLDVLHEVAEGAVAETVSEETAATEQAIEAEEVKIEQTVAALHEIANTATNAPMF